MADKLGFGWVAEWFKAAVLKTPCREHLHHHSKPLKSANPANIRESERARQARSLSVRAERIVTQGGTK